MKKIQKILMGTGIFIVIAVLIISIIISAYNIQYMKNYSVFIERINSEHNRQVEIMQDHLESMQTYLEVSQLQLSAAQREQFEFAQRKQLKAAQQQLADFTSGIANDLLSVREMDEKILETIIEKAVNDYILMGVEYFNDAAYGKAYTEFTKALRYMGDNTTVAFYQLYCLYLNKVNERLDEETCNSILDSLVILNNNSYKSSEQLGFTEEEMRKKISDMAFNIEEIKKQEGLEAS